MMTFFFKNFRVLLLASILFFLNGCAGLFLAGAATGGLIIYEKRPIEVIHEDQNIRHQALLRFKADRRFQNNRLTATSFNKMLLLVGQIHSSALRSEAEKAARMVPNIRRLYNLISIGPPISLAQQTEDLWITTKIKAQLLAAPQIRSGMIKVVTEDRTVYLLGKVTQKQSQRIVHIVSAIPGVKKIVKIFDYDL